MKPLDQLIAAIRTALEDRQMTPAALETFRQLWLHALRFDTTDADTARAALITALDTGARPDARSFATDSGIV
jgi:hypothetical protein